MTTIFRLVLDLPAQLLVIFYPGVLVFWLIIHSNIERWRKVGQRAFWIASIGWPLTAGPLLYFRAEIFALRWNMPHVVAGLGIIAFVVTLVLGWQASRSISRRTLIGLAELEPHKNNEPLLETGIYSKTRNPIYLAHWLLIFFTAAITGFAANWILFALDSILLPLIVRVEERELRGRYGSEYAAYTRRVPRFFPRLT